MITWMQTHKKWLIITIWIATIAFVGAGFVGWGAYSYGKKQDEIARVKDTPVKVKDVQDIYSELFNRLNQQMGGKLDEATAKKLGLERAALTEAIRRAMLIQFAKDNGLYITDEELAQTIISIPAFQKNGKFDKTIYKKYLKSIGMTPKEFESKLRKNLLIQKVVQAVSLPSTKTTQKTMASFMFMEDKLSIKTINAPKVSVTEDEIKTFWEKNKNNYKSILSYTIGYYYVIPDTNLTEAEISNYYDEHKTNYTDANGKILPLEDVKEEVKRDLIAKKTKKEAILTMKKLKNDQLKFNIAQNVTLNNPYIPADLMKKLIKTKFLKPVFTKKGWLIATIIKINQPSVLPYEKAKEFAKADLIKEKTIKALIKIAKEELKTFKGKNIGFIGRSDAVKLKGMDVNEAITFLTYVFSYQTPKGFVLLPQNNPTKAVLFNITEQKLLDTKKYEKYNKLVVSLADKTKSDQLNINLIKQLQKLYEADIKIYIKL